MRTWQRVRRQSSSLSSLAVAAMEDLPWFRALPPAERSQVGLVVQAGLNVFAHWLRDGGGSVPVGPEVFAAAPRELTRAVSLKQTVQLVRITVDVVEGRVPSLAAAGDEEVLRSAVLRYSREVAFAAAEVYAAAAEARGAWDARLEASVVDALVRGHAGELALSRAASLGWGPVEWVVGLATPAAGEVDVDALRAAARRTGLSLLTGEATPALVVVLGGPGATGRAVEQVVRMLPDGPVVVGPEAAELAQAGDSVQEAVAGLSAVAGWPAAPRPVQASALLAERALRGEPAARRRLLEDVYQPLAAAGGDLLDTAAAYLEGGASIEGAGRTLFLHPNTIRYRLKKIEAVLGRDLSSPRDALVIRLALLVGRTSPL